MKQFAYNLVKELVRASLGAGFMARASLGAGFEDL